MLNPSPSEAPNPAEAAAARGQDRPLGARPLELDPAWRAGRKLAEARRQLGLSLDEVAERIRVRREFLEALEAMNVKVLPGKAYALAFLRSYARALSLDERAIVDQFQDECALTREDVQKQVRNPSSKPHQERPWAWALAIVLVAAGFVGSRALMQQGASAPGQTEAQVSAPAEPTAPAIVSEAHMVEVRALADEWLEARGPDGTVFLSQTLKAGEVYRPDASPGWTLHARDGGAFELFVNGVPAGLLGAAGSPVLGRPIDQIAPVVQASAEAGG